jgi:hypothetical protein
MRIIGHKILEIHLSPGSPWYPDAIDVTVLVYGSCRLKKVYIRGSTDEVRYTINRIKLDIRHDGSRF